MTPRSCSGSAPGYRSYHAGCRVVTPLASVARSRGTALRTTRTRPALRDDPGSGPCVRTRCGRSLRPRTTGSADRSASETVGSRDVNLWDTRGASCDAPFQRVGLLVERDGRPATNLAEILPALGVPLTSALAAMLRKRMLWAGVRHGHRSPRRCRSCMGRTRA